jgi:hypothetical protein
LSGVSGVTKGTLAGSNPYTLPISGFTASGEIKVEVAKAGFTINGSPKTVAISYSTPINAITPANLESFLATLPYNNASIPYNITLRVTSVNEFETIRTALNEASIKYVKLDLTGSTVTSIVDGAFDNCLSLTGVSIPNGVTSIGDSAFNYCFSLTDVSIPNGVTSIGDRAFLGCGLASVIIPNSVINIGDRAFFSCRNLSRITLPSNITSIGISTFYGCTSLDNVTIPDKVTSIENFAFYGCTSLASVTIPDRVTSIGSYTFYDCTSLANITIPNSVTSIGSDAFSGCKNLTIINVGLGNIVYTAEDGVLYNKSKTTLIAYPTASGSFTIPNGVTSIEDRAFSSCGSLVSVTIPNSVSSIRFYAFDGCSSLSSVTFQGTIPSSVLGISSYAFPGDLRDKFYASNSSNGTPGTYTRAPGGWTWTRQ